MKINKKQSSGFSLVELMVAMLIGLIIISGAFSLHLGTREAQVVNEMQMDLVADARFAIEMIAYDLRHAGMWGGTNKDSLIDCKSNQATPCGSGAPPTTAINDCATAVNEWSFDLSQPVFATNNDNPYATTCIPAAEQYLAGTDVLEIRYADSNVATTLVANQAYVRSNFTNGRLFIGDTAPVLDSYDTSALTLDHELHAYAYYISDYTDAVDDGIPSLRRAALVGGPEVKNQLLISGVSDLQVQFGVDVDDDEIIDRYVDPDAVTDWSEVYAAKIWLLMRSNRQQRGADTTKSFSMAGAAAATYGGQDDYRYFMVSSVVNLRNMKQL